MTQALQVVEICAGAGGQSLGLELAGFEHKLAVELDADACATLTLNRPQWDVARGDVADRRVFDPADYHGIDLLAGGVPCPPFSIAGRQLGAGDERDLFAFAVTLVRQMKPQAVLLENVRGLAAQRFSAYRSHVLSRLKHAGYVASWRLVQASDFGVPQLRPRFVLVALRREFAPYFWWPDDPADPGTVGETIVDLMGARGWPGAEAWSKAANGIAPTVVGGSKKHGGADLGPTRAKEAWKRLRVDAHGVADEAPGPDAGDAHDPKLTVEMVARLQGWLAADDYEWSFAGRKTSRYRQIGNAFPPPVARALGESIATALRKDGASATPPRNSHAHDPVYAVLRKHRSTFLTAAQIHGLAETIPWAEVERRLEDLQQDFELKTADVEGDPGYKLGKFRGFTGQGNHWRHQHFAKHREQAASSR